MRKRQTKWIKESGKLNSTNKILNNKHVCNTDMNHTKVPPLVSSELKIFEFEDFRFLIGQKQK